MKTLALVLDFGAAHKEMVARTARALGVYTEIYPGNIPVEQIQALNPIGIMTTGDATGHDSHLAGLDVPRIDFPTDFGQTSPAEVIQSFLFDRCKATGDYKLEDYIQSQIEKIRETVGDQRVLLGLSGGVDSSVCAALLSKAIPGQLTCVFVDHGLMRLNEGDEIQEIFSKHDLDFIRVDAAPRFMEKLKGVTDPEAKRKIIGEEFIRVFEAEAKKLGRIPFLAQGTIYPDIVESGNTFANTIKSHHNVGGLPEKLDFDQLVEPLSGLFKNEVRKIGLLLGLPEHLVNRQPFPGPGLAVRAMGELTWEKLEMLRKADAIVREELGRLDPPPDQYFAVLTDTYSVGMKNGNRTYDPVLAIRAVVTQDFMTATCYNIPYALLCKLATAIPQAVDGVSRVVYDISSKPPGTVEWQ